MTASAQVVCHGCSHPLHAGQCPHDCVCRTGSPPGASGVTATAQENALWRPPPSLAEMPVDPHVRLCVACGGYHGGVNERINCLERWVAGLRAENERLRAGERS